MVMIWKKWHFMEVNLKVNAEIVERLDTSCSNVKIEEIKMVITTVAIRLVELSSKSVSNSRKGTHDSTITTLTPVTVTLVIVIKKTLSRMTWFSRRHRMQRSLRMTYAFMIVVQVHTIVLRIDVKKINENIRVGNGEFLKATKIGSFKCKVIQIDGSTFNIILHNVNFVPNLWVNLFSINQALKKGHMISNDELTISLSKESTKVTFDGVFKAKDGAVLGVKMIAYNDPVAYFAVTMDLKKGVEINRFDKMLGHYGSDKIENDRKHSWIQVDWRIQIM
jgi:hypothetical protein